MTKSEAAEVKAAGELYTIADIARHFGVSSAAVWYILNGRSHKDVRPAAEAPNIDSSRVSRDILREDWPLLRQRGMSVVEAAKYLGVHHSTLYRAIKEGAA